jgi:toxin ParE1/3/4
VSRRAVISVVAVDDLRQIGDFIAADNPRAALSFVRALRSKCRSVTRHPLAYPSREDLAPGVRQAQYGHYLILFRLLPGGTVMVLRVVHGARDLGRISLADPE